MKAIEQHRDGLASPGELDGTSGFHLAHEAGKTIARRPAHAPDAGGPGSNRHSLAGRGFET